MLTCRHVHQAAQPRRRPFRPRPPRRVLPAALLLGALSAAGECPVPCIASGGVRVREQPPRMLRLCSNCTDDRHSSFRTTLSNILHTSSAESLLAGSLSPISDKRAQVFGNRRVIKSGAVFSLWNRWSNVTRSIFVLQGGRSNSSSMTAQAKISTLSEQ